MKYEIVVCKPMIHTFKYEVEATSPLDALDQYGNNSNGLIRLSEVTEERYHTFSHDLDEVHITPISDQSTPSPNQSKDTPLGFVPASFDEVQPGDRVLFPDTVSPLFEVVCVLGDAPRTKVLGRHIGDPMDVPYYNYDRPRWDVRSPVYARCRGYIP